MNALWHDLPMWFGNSVIIYRAQTADLHAVGSGFNCLSGSFFVEVSGTFLDTTELDLGQHI